MLHLSGKTFDVFFGYSSSLCGLFAYHPSAIPSDNHSNEFLIFGVMSSMGREGLMDASEMWTAWMRTHTFSSLLFLLLLFFQIKDALQVSYLSTGQRMCFMLPLNSYKNCWKAFFNCISLQTSQKIFISYYFRTYRIRVTITWHISFFIHVCV